MTPKRNRVHVYYVVALLGFLPLTGCIALAVGGAAAAGGAAVAFVSGELQGVEPSSMEKSFLATNRALEDLGFEVKKRQRDALASEIIAHSTSDKRVLVQLERESDKVTRIRIRVGIFGDEAVSRLVLKRIESNLEAK